MRPRATPRPRRRALIAGHQRGPASRARHEPYRRQAARPPASQGSSAGIGLGASRPSSTLRRAAAATRIWPMRVISSPCRRPRPGPAARPAGPHCRPRTSRSRRRAVQQAAVRSITATARSAYGLEVGHAHPRGEHARLFVRLGGRGRGAMPRGTARAAELPGPGQHLRELQLVHGHRVHGGPEGSGLAIHQGELELGIRQGAGGADALAGGRRRSAGGTQHRVGVERDAHGVREAQCVRHRGGRLRRRGAGPRDQRHQRETGSRTSSAAPHRDTAAARATRL
jgi:hypothetical protein